MAKKKETTPIEQEVIVEETSVEPMEEPIIEEPVYEEPAHDDTFTDRTLKAINQMENKAKAKRLANRLMRKKARNH